MQCFDNWSLNLGAVAAQLGGRRQKSLQPPSNILPTQNCDSSLLSWIPGQAVLTEARAANCLDQLTDSRYGQLVRWAKDEFLGCL